MCEKGDLTWVPELGPYGRYIDTCMVDTIRFMNEGSEIETLACCCGHGIYPETVIIRTSEGVWEHTSGVTIKRKRNFYKKDENGLYYIPEVVNS